jgi:phosphoribosylformylglycinamidine synthase
MIHLFKNSEQKTELCFNIEASKPLTPKQLRRLKLILADGFIEETIREKTRISPTTKIVRLGPHMNFATPYSSNLVTTCHACGIPQISRVECFRHNVLKPSDDRELFVEKNHDRMTESEYFAPLETFDSGIKPEPVWTIPMIEKGPDALLNIESMPFDASDRQRYYDYFVGKKKRNPTCVEVYDLANTDSNHSRHHDFKAKNIIDGKEMLETFMEIVQSTWKANPDNSVIAFDDNASAIKGFKCLTLVPTNPGQVTGFTEKHITYCITFSAETHNFPTGIAAYPGEETGIGGWIRDMLCAGKGSLVLFALSGQCVGRLCIPGYPLPWEEAFNDFEYPRIQESGLKVGIRGTDGFFDYGNCFGVPSLGGFFRSFGSRLPNGRRIEPIKPVAYVGGGGIIDARHVKKGKAIKGLKIVRIGGPAYNVGFLGGAASSKEQGENTEEVDRNAVQRGDAEMERKSGGQVIYACVSMGDRNPIVSAHDQGAGGPGNVLKELVEKAGGRVHLRRINVGDPTLSTAQIWVAEYQEGFAFLIHEDRIEEFQAICKRENVNCEILGEVTGDGRFTVVDDIDDSTPVDFDLDFVLGDVPQKTFTDVHVDLGLKPLELPSHLTLEKALSRVLREVSVACKSWLTDKSDRTVLGRTVLQQCVGPLQLPLANCSVAALSPIDTVGIVSALGENPHRLMVDPAAGGRMAVSEMLTNIIWGFITDLRDISCSANWMWAPKIKGERAAMYDTAIAVRDYMIALRTVINGGKDSLSMATQVFEEMVISLRQLVIGGYVGCPDITKYVTPDIKRPGDSILVLADPSFGQARLGGSTLAHVYGGQYGNESPDVEHVNTFVSALNSTQEFIKKDLILSGHDRSDGGLITALLEMAFGGNCGLDLSIQGKHSVLDQMLAEETALIYEVSPKNEDQVLSILDEAKIPAQILGKTICADNVFLKYNGSDELNLPMTTLREWWMETAYQMEAQQSNPETAKEKYKNLNKAKKPKYFISFEPKPTPPEIMVKKKNYPTAILRDEGTNGHEEMTNAAYLAGLYPVDVHMTDLISGKATLDDYLFLVTPGGFPNKDVPQAGKASAAKIMFNDRVWETYQRFLERSTTLTLGVCSGCQINTLLGLVPWRGIEPAKQPRLETNLSNKFESEWITLKILDSPSILHRKMAGTVIGAWVAHGEGRFYFPDETILNKVLDKDLVTMEYVDHEGKATQRYPFNPNGSPHAIAGLTSPDGRHTVCMPHPIDRSFQMWQWSRMPDEFKGLKSSPWLQIFQNAQEFFEQY